MLSSSGSGRRSANVGTEGKRRRWGGESEWGEEIFRVL
jgi:hypothetical protein